MVLVSGVALMSKKPLDHTFSCGCRAMTAIDEDGQKAFMFVACPKQLECHNTKMMISLAAEVNKPIEFHICEKESQ